MGIIICVYNLKGGVGKTTTTLNLAASLGEQGHSVLVVDVDSQASLTVHCGFPLFSLSHTIYHALLGQKTLAEILHSTHMNHVDILPADLELTGAEREMFSHNPLWGNVLHGLLQPFKTQYEYILIDCPASALVLTTNAAVAADLVLCPLQCESVNLHVWQIVAQSIQRWGKLRGVPLPVWIVRTLLDRTKHNQLASQTIKQALGDLVLDTVIKRRTDVANAMSNFQPVLQYDYHCEAAGLYRTLAVEVKTRIQEELYHG